jgi:hypothetical protein
MASVQRLVLQTGAISGASGQTDPFSLEAYVTDVIGSVTVSAAAFTTFDVYLQHSPDGSTWFDVVQLAKPGGGSLTTTGAMIASTTSPILGKIRIRWALTGGAQTATAEFVVYYDKRK